jgi:hypothetical protein
LFLSRDLHSPFSAVIVIMAPLFLPSGFKYRRFFSAGAFGPAPVQEGASLAEGLGNGTESSATTATAVALEERRCRRREYDRSRVFQDIWAAKLPWAKSVLGNDGRVHQVRCLVCTKIEGRDKLLTPKLDSLWKHGGRRRAHTDIPGVAKKGEYYTALDCRHLKNEVLFLAIGRDTVAKQIAAGTTLEQKKKIV